LKRGLAALLLVAAIGVAGAAVEVLTPAQYRRSEDQTFLTFPEWYLVHSPAEFAHYLSLQRAPSEFPWCGHVGQFWQGYLAVTRETKDDPFNGGYHLMVSVIGGSTTVEYGLRSAYESTIGRLAEAGSDGGPTAEDRLAARVAQAYVEFIRSEPWYRFDFVAPLRELWTATPAAGPNLLRKWERRYALTTEYAIKAGYARLIKLATQSVYEDARPVTAVVLDRAPAPLPPALTELRRIDGGDDGVLVTVPRYHAFVAYAQALAGQGRGFREIAGNRGPIAASLIERSTAAQPAAPSHTIFVQPILTQPGWERRVIAVPVAELAPQLQHWRASGVQVEHIYDY
jgi:hypothetical protein